MASIGYWAAHEQYSLHELLKFVVEAEKGGFTTPVYRYHPAIIAQAFASIDTLYPGRIGLGLGSGEAMNESPLGFDWPRSPARLTRTEEAIHIIRQLWDQGKANQGFVNFNGEYFLIRNAKLYTLPASRIPIYMAATGQQATKI